MIHHVKAVPAHQTRGLVADVYRQMKRDFAILADPFTLHSPIPELLAEAWALGRETVITDRYRET